MTVKDLLEITDLWGQWRVHQSLGGDSSKKIGDFRTSEFRKFNEWKVEYIQPEGDDFYVEIAEEEK